MSSITYERWDPAGPGHADPVSLALRTAGLESFLADSQPEGVAVADSRGRITDVNAAMERRTGLSREQLLTRRAVDLVGPDHRRRLETALTDALGGAGARTRARVARTSPIASDLSLTLVPLFDSARQVVGVLILTQDLSVAEEAERERLRDGRLLELAGRVAGFTGWALDLENGSMEWSGRIAAFSERLPGSLQGLKHMLDDIDAVRLQRAVDRALRERRVLDITVRVISGAHERHVRLVGEPLTAETARSRVLRGAAHDVTDTVVEQRERLQVERLLGTTLGALTDGWAIVDVEWRFTFVNERLAAMIDVERESLIGVSMWDAVPQIVGTEFEIAFRAAVHDSMTVQVRDRVGSGEQWMEAIAYPSDGGLAVLLRDVTEAERAAQSYRKAQNDLARLGRLLDIAREAILVIDTQRRLMYANAGARDLFDVKRDGVDGLPLGELADFDADQLESSWQRALDDGHWSGPVSLRTVDGREIVLASRMQLMFDEVGEPESVLCVATDITDDILREETVRRAERMESIGTFAGGIAHDLNNLLTPILMAAQLLRRNLAAPHHADTVDMIEAAARRGADMVRQVLGFARGLEPRNDDVEVGAVLEELRSLFADTVPPRIDLRIGVPAERMVVSGDATQLLQALVNLVGNAVDAIEGDGRIDVEARVLPGSADRGARVVLSVVDTGHGIAPQVASRLWEPFFTTKESGRGTGLGLAMVAAIVRAHAGDIAADSDGHSGSTFRIELPLVRVLGHGVAEQPPAPDDPEGQGELVLVVDDDPAIRTVLRAMLVETGFEVVVAPSGDDALALIDSGRVSPAVVLSDVMMPRGGGLDVLAHLASTDIPVVLMSGRQDRSMLGLDREIAFLQKPFATSELLAVVRRALGRSPRPAQKAIP